MDEKYYENRHEKNPKTQKLSYEDITKQILNSNDEKVFQIYR